MTKWSRQNLEAHNNEERGLFANIPPKRGTLRIVGKRTHAELWEGVRFAHTEGRNRVGIVGRSVVGIVGRSEGGIVGRSGAYSDMWEETGLTGNCGKTISQHFDLRMSPSGHRLKEGQCTGIAYKQSKQLKPYREPSLGRTPNRTLL